MQLQDAAKQTAADLGGSAVELERQRARVRQLEAYVGAQAELERGLPPQFSFCVLVHVRVRCSDMEVIRADGVKELEAQKKALAAKLQKAKDEAAAAAKAQQER